MATKSAQGLLDLLGIKNQSQSQIDLIDNFVASGKTEAVELYLLLGNTIAGSLNKADMEIIGLWLHSTEMEGDEAKLKCQALVKRLENEMKDFPNFVVFFIGKHGNGACFAHTEGQYGEAYLSAQLVDTFRSQPALRGMFENAINISYEQEP